MLRAIARRLSSYPELKRVLKYSFQGVMFLLNFHRAKFRCRFQVIRQTDESGGFFGYYDKSPESPNGKYLLWHRIVKSEGKNIEAEICVKSVESGAVQVIGRTSAVNFQIGARLQWLDNDRLIYNDYNREADSYYSVVYSISAGSRRELNAPVFDVSGNLFLTLDFKHLTSCGSEYGYFSHKQSTGSKPEIRIGDLETGSSKSLLNADEIFDIKKLPDDAVDIHFNHLLFSPTGTRFIFFLRFTASSGRQEYLLLHDLLKKETVLLNSEMTSHCCWVDDRTVAGYLSHKDKPGFYTIDISSLQYKELFSESNPGDGHPSFKNGVFMFDSYPDNSRMQHLFISGSNQTLLAGSFYSPLIFDEFYRCDLHPRFSQDGKRIYFDSLHSGERHLYSLEFTTHE